MPNEFISKMARYVAFLQREADVWYYEGDRRDMSSYFLEKVDTARDICAMFGCVKDVWDEAKKIYDFTNSGKVGYEYKAGRIVKVEGE